MNNQMPNFMPGYPPMGPNTQFPPMGPGQQFPPMGPGPQVPPWNNQNMEMRQLEERVNRLEKDVRRLNTRVTRLEAGVPTPYKAGANYSTYQADSYNMM